MALDTQLAEKHMLSSKNFPTLKTGHWNSREWVWESDDLKKKINEKPKETHWDPVKNEWYNGAERDVYFDEETGIWKYDQGDLEGSVEAIGQQRQTDKSQIENLFRYDFATPKQIARKMAGFEKSGIPGDEVIKLGDAFYWKEESKNAYTRGKPLLYEIKF